MKRILFCLCVLGLIAPVMADEPAFRATVRRNATNLKFATKKDKTVIEVRCPAGIDRAAIERLQKSWGKQVVLQFHLRGLESVKVSNGKVTLAGGVNSGGRAFLSLLEAGKKAQPLNKKSPYFTQIKIVGGNKKVPLKGGYFELPLPAKFFEGNPKSINVNWVDFFRG